MNGHFLRAQQLLELKRSDLAEVELRLALADEPNHAASHALLAACLLDLGETRAAEDEAKTAIGLAPEEPFAFFTLSRVYASRNRYEQAFGAIDEALRLAPWSADFHFFRGALLHDTGRYEPCLQEAAAGLREDPQHVSCRNLRVSALIELKRYDEADAEIDRVLQLNPEFAWTHENKARIALRNNDAGAALTHFREALRLHPNSESARRGLVAALKLRNVLFRGLLWVFANRDDDRRYGFLFRGFIVSFALSAMSGVVFALFARMNEIDFIGRWVVATVGGLMPCFIAYLMGLVLYHWFANAWFVLMLRFDRLGRHALNTDDVRSSNLMLSGGGLIATSAVAAAMTQHAVAAYGLCAAVVFTICVAIIYSQPPGPARRIWTVLCIAVPTVLFLIVYLSSISETFMKDYAFGATILSLIAAWIYVWAMQRAAGR